MCILWHEDWGMPARPFTIAIMNGLNKIVQHFRPFKIVTVNGLQKFPTTINTNSNSTSLEAPIWQVFNLIRPPILLEWGHIFGNIGLQGSFSLLSAFRCQNIIKANCYFQTRQWLSCEEVIFVTNSNSTFSAVQLLKAIHNRYSERPTNEQQFRSIGFAWYTSYFKFLGDGTVFSTGKRFEF